MTVIAKAKQRLQAGLVTMLGRTTHTVRRVTGAPASGATLVVPPTSPGSLGDEAMMAACVQRLRASGVTRIGVVQFESERGWPGIKGDLEMVPLAGYFGGGFAAGAARFADQVRDYEQFWILGADVLDGRYSPAASVRRIQLAHLAALAGLRTTILGFSFHEAAAPEAIRALAALPPQVRLCARDPLSWQRLVAAVGRPIALVADTAFQLKADPADPAIEDAARWLATRRAMGDEVLGLNVSHQPFRSERAADPEQVVALHVAALRELLDQAPSRSVLVIPHDYRDPEGYVSDATLGQQVVDRLGAGERVHAVHGRLTAGGAKHLVGQVDAALVGRMHLAIGALGQGVPAGGIAYQGKFQGLYQHFELPPLTLSPVAALVPGALAGFARALLGDRARLAATIQASLPQVRARSRRNFEPEATGARRALVVTPEPTHPVSKGNRARLVDMIARLEEAGYEVDVAHVERIQGERATMAARWGERYHPIPYRYPIGALARVGRRARRTLLDRHELGLDDWYSERSHAFLAQLARVSFDVVVVNYVHQSRALDLFGPATLKVLDTHDRFAGRFERAAAVGEPRAGYSTTLEDEARGLARADVVIAIQDHEREAFARAVPHQHVITIGHRVPLVEAAPEPAQPTILFFGSRNQANVDGLRWFVREVMPRVRQVETHARLVVAGEVGDVVRDPGIDVALGVVANPATAYAAATVVVAALRFGTGLKIKTIEALGQGRPVIATSIGAEGLEDASPAALRIADTAPAMAAAIVELLASPTARAGMREAAATWVAAWNERSGAAFKAVFGDGRGAPHA